LKALDKEVNLRPPGHGGKMKIIAVLSLAMAIVLPAGSEGNGFELWTPSQLKALERQLSVRLDAQKFAAQGLGTFGNHSFMIAHREGNGQAELHQTQNDVFLVQSGQATLVVGGTLVEPKTVAAHEIRGSSISGGERKALGPGDVVHISAGIPHQLLVDAGKEFTYFVVKIDAK
jgi:mannose-6-phosphate isomerase-like protein (cupin superfamily)